MLKSPSSMRAGMRGLSLIELMIALVIGLIVSGAAVALVVSIMKANAETIRATRLTQELRTTTEIISREMRRAKSVEDPVANVGLASANMLKNCDDMTPATAGTTAACATFGYDCKAKSDGTFDSGTFKAIGLANGKVKLASSSSAVPSCPTGGAGTQLSSDLINISELTVCVGVFNSTGSCVSAGADVYSVRVRGSFINDPTGLVRSISQEVRIRSTAIN
jgi:type IV pilus assembly protein PilW